MKISNISLNKKYISFNEPFTLSATVTMGSSESLAMYDGIPGYINLYLVVGNEFYKSKDKPYNYGYDSGRFDGTYWYDYDYDINKITESYSADWYSVSVMFNPTEAEAEKGESGYAFSDVVTLAAGKSKTYTRECFINPSDMSNLINYINRWYEGSSQFKFKYDLNTEKIILPTSCKNEEDLKEYAYNFPENQYNFNDINWENSGKYEDGKEWKVIEYNQSGDPQPILDYTKRRIPFRLLVVADDYRENATEISNIVSNTSKTTIQTTPPSDTSTFLGYTAGVDLGCFILYRVPPVIGSLEIKDNWCNKIYYNTSNAKESFVCAKNTSNLTFSANVNEIKLDTEVDPTLTISQYSLKITNSSLGEVYSQIITDKVGVFQVPSSTFLDAGSYTYTYSVTDSAGQTSSISDIFYVEDYKEPEINFSIERVVLERAEGALNNYSTLISDEGVFLRTFLQIKNTIFQNKLGKENILYYKKTWENLDNIKDTPLISAPLGEEELFKGYDFFGTTKKETFLSHTVDKQTDEEKEENKIIYFTRQETLDNNQNPIAETFTLSIEESKEDYSIIKRSLSFLSGPYVVLEETDIQENPYHYIEYSNANEYEITLYIIDYFKTYAYTITVEKTGGILNVEQGGISIGMRHSDPLNDQAPSFLINYPATFLQSMILTEGINLGKELPKTGVHGQLFFKYTL